MTDSTSCTSAARADATSNAAAAADAASSTTGVSGGGLMCAPVLNADGNVIAVCLLSNKLTSADEDSAAFTDDDEKVKGAFLAATH